MNIETFISPKLRSGAVFVDLTPELRKKLERNTGALVELVFEDTPAFYADILKGNVLISIDNRKVLNGRQAVSLINDIPEAAETSTLIILRNGKEVDLKVNYKITSVQL